MSQELDFLSRLVVLFGSYIWGTLALVINDVPYLRYFLIGININHA